MRRFQKMQLFYLITQMLGSLTLSIRILEQSYPEHTFKDLSIIVSVFLLLECAVFVDLVAADVA